MQTQYGNQFYHRAQNLCPVYTKLYDDQLDNYDVILMPTLPHTAPLQPRQDLSLQQLFWEMFNMTVNTAPTNYTGHPALTLNVGHSAEEEGGLPVGAMIMAKKWHEQTILNVAYALERGLAATTKTAQ